MSSTQRYHSSYLLNFLQTIHISSSLLFSTSPSSSPLQRSDSSTSLSAVVSAIFLLVVLLSLACFFIPGWILQLHLFHFLFFSYEQFPIVFFKCCRCKNVSVFMIQFRSLFHEKMFQNHLRL